MNTTTSLVYTFHNYSLLENAFVDDSADISSDETLFSISPSGFDDSENQTPLPTITTPLHELNNSTPTNEDTHRCCIKTPTLVRIMENELKPVEYLNEEPERANTPTPVNQPSTIVELNQASEIKIVHEKPPLEIKSILKSDEADEKSEISKVVTLVVNELKTEVAKKAQEKSVQLAVENSNQLKDSSFVNKSQIMKLSDASTKCIDMKSQMAKYNDYLFYLKHGFPRKY